MQAKTDLESGRLNDVERYIATGEGYLAGLPDDETVELRAEFARLRAELAKQPTEEENRSLSAAKNSIRALRSRIADRQTIGAEQLVEKAEKYLGAVREEHRGAVMTDLAAARSELVAAIEGDKPKPKDAPAPALAAAAPAPTAAPAPIAHAAPAAVAHAATPPMTATTVSVAAGPPPLSDEDQSKLSRARSRLTFARSAVESGRLDGIEDRIAEVATILDELPAHASADLRAQLDEIRTAAGKRDLDEKVRRVTDELDRHLSGAESSISTGRHDSTTDGIATVKRRLTEADCAVLGPEQIARYEQRMRDIQAKLDATIKADAIDRALPLIAELEDIVANDPYAGLDERAVYDRSSRIHSLGLRVQGAVRRAPATDRDIASILDRLGAVDRKAEEAQLAWGKAVLDASVSNSWSSIEEAIAGWDSETSPEDKPGFWDPVLPRTHMAIQRTRYLLDGEDTKKLRAEHPDDAAIQGPFQAAERVLADAGAKLAAAYHAVLEAAEKIETPLNQITLSRPGQIAYNAAAALDGTKHKDEVVDRARKLDARWKAEVAAIHQARKELFDKLAKETETTWPQMRDATEAQPFDKSSAQPGMKVRFDGVYNRIGWDYGSRKYDFATRYDGVVFAGAYAPEVLAALEHAWYELKLEVTDRFTWDVIAVIEEPDKIGKRTQTTLRDASTGAEIGKLESWPDIDCVRVRIVGLHAGPVAVTTT